MKEEIAVNKVDLLSAYKNANNEQKDLLEHLFGSEVFKPADVKERIKTFADATKAVGIESPEEWEEQHSCLEPEVLAYFKLRIITKALNEGWEPKFSPGEYLWAPQFLFYTKEKIEKMNAETKARVVRRSGSYGFSYSGVSCWGAGFVPLNAGEVIGPRLAFKSKELAEYAGKQFLEIYADFCLKSKENL
ncbi:MAG: hypothetical protein IKL83_03865 [Muribaculaceae bacterium]|nr:hypothetical protein [Muribaculaceae bacterium]